MTKSEIVYAINMPNVTEKTIKRWEEDKEFPNLEMIYKLSEILQLNPTELLIFRDRSRKLFLRSTTEPKNSTGPSESFKENLYYGFQAFARIFICVVVAAVLGQVVGFGMRMYADDAGRFINTVTGAIDEGVNETSNNEDYNVINNVINENADFSNVTNEDGIFNNTVNENTIFNNMIN